MRAATVGLVLAVAASAAAQPVAPVAADIDRCGDVDPAAVRRVMEVELGRPLVAPRPGVTSVVVRCDGDRVLLSAEDPATGRVMRRPIELAAAPGKPSARVRLVALAAVELVAALQVDLRERPPEPAPPPPGRPQRTLELVQPIVELAGEREPPRWTLAVSGVMRFGEGLGTVGVGAAGSARVGRVLLLGGDVVYEHGVEGFELGDVTGNLLSVAPRAGVVWPVGFVDLEATAGARLGIAFLSGQPSEMGAVLGRSFTAAWGGPTACVALRAGRRLATRLAVEVAWNVVHVDATIGAQARQVIGGVGALVSLAVATGW